MQSTPSLLHIRSYLSFFFLRWFCNFFKNFPLRLSLFVCLFIYFKGLFGICFCAFLWGSAFAWGYACHLLHLSFHFKCCHLLTVIPIPAFHASTAVGEELWGYLVPMWHLARGLVSSGVSYQRPDSSRNLVHRSAPLVAQSALVGILCHHLPPASSQGPLCWHTNSLTLICHFT